MRMLKDILERILTPTAQLTTPAANMWDPANFSLAGMPDFSIGMDSDDIFPSGWMSGSRVDFR